MAQIDKVIEYLKNSVEVNETVDPEEMLRDVFGIKRKLISEYQWVSDKKEIKVGDKVKIISHNIIGSLQETGNILTVTDVDYKDIGREIEVNTGAWFSLSSVELV